MFLLTFGEANSSPERQFSRTGSKPLKSGVQFLMYARVLFKALLKQTIQASIVLLAHAGKPLLVLYQLPNIMPDFQYLEANKQSPCCDFHKDSHENVQETAAFMGPSMWKPESLPKHIYKAWRPNSKTHWIWSHSTFGTLVSHIGTPLDTSHVPNKPRCGRRSFNSARFAANSWTISSSSDFAAKNKGGTP